MSGKRKGTFSGYAPYNAALKRTKKAAQPPLPSMRRTTAQRQRTALRGFLGSAGEAKFFDIAAGQVSLTTDGTISHLDIVPTGATVNSRDGRKFRNTSVQIRGFAQSLSTTTVCTGAMYLVWDRQPNKALTAINQILDNVTPVSFTKRENAQRFRILKKWRWAFAGNASTAGQQTTSSIYDIDDYIKLPDDCIAECTSADTTGAIGNRITGALLLVTCGTGNPTVATDDAAVNITTRVNFVDI